MYEFAGSKSAKLVVREYGKLVARILQSIALPEYVILDDFWSLYPRYTWGRAGVFLFSCIFHILDKSAESWCNCSLCRPELV
jgi:hypothetical protein